MKSIQFRPLLWPTLFSIVSFLVLISLGTWQVKRLFWKNNIISNYTEKFEKNKILYEKSFKYDGTYQGVQGRPHEHCQGTRKGRSERGGEDQGWRHTTHNRQ